jgi:hypothetical protein
VLDERDRATVKRVRGFKESEIAPIIEDYWGRDQFPFVDRGKRGDGLERLPNLLRLQRFPPSLFRHGPKPSAECHETLVDLACRRSRRPIRGR